jgi:Raf kinase inhibitor-like YbhB/YbcL family protein
MFTLSSSAFEDGQRIPLDYVAVRGGGHDRSIPLAWSGAPAGTASFAVTIVDHAPVARMWVHWAVVDIPPTATILAEGASGTSAMPAGVRELDSTYGTPRYGGPNPPAGTGDHPYVATVYALSVPHLDVPVNATLDTLGRAMAGRILAQASVTGMYSR